MLAMSAPAVAHGMPDADAQRLADGSVLHFMISGAMHMTPNKKSKMVIARDHGGRLSYR
jgi:hypothetical protein